MKVMEMYMKIVALSLFLRVYANSLKLSRTCTWYGIVFNKTIGTPLLL